ncbi:MAG: sulfatase, partial [Actinomycetota bacterium]|nr:sulfatase [Actinomycetota bacterium]
MNIILIILDSLRKDHVGAYGNSWIKTPSLDALSRESLRFTRAYPESIPTLPARRAIHTGLRTWPFRNWDPPEGETFMPAGWQRIPEEQTTLSEILLAEGYNTVLFSDTQHLFKASYNFQRGFKVYDWIRGQERDRYRPTMRVPQEQVEKMVVPGNSENMVDKVRQYLANTANRESEEDWFAPRVFTMASEFLKTADRGQPFFLVVDCYDPHEPWDPPEEYVSLYGEGYDGPEPTVPEYGDAGWIGERELERMRNLYAAEVTMTDRWLGNFLDKIDELNLSENTLLLVLSDHGVALGEHDATGKPFWALWPELTDIPFFIRHPEGKGAGQTSSYYASTHDVAPTVLGFLGMESPKPMDGKKLSVLFEGGEPDPREHFTLGYDNYVWTRDDRYA